MDVFTTPTFRKNEKHLHPNQRKQLDKAVLEIIANPVIGEPKVGDLSGCFIFKFRINNQQWLLAYEIVTGDAIKLLALGSHENFYRELKN